LRKGRMIKAGEIVIDEHYPRVQRHNPDDVIVRVCYCAINADDYSAYIGKVGKLYSDDGLFHEMSGRIAEVGPVAESLGFRVGDRVSRNPLSGCGSCVACKKGKPQFCVVDYTPGCSAEYIVCRANSLIRIPDDISMEEGALYWLCAVCVRCVERLQVQPGDSVLILGGGASGLLLLQLLKKRMASQIVVSDPIASKREVALQLGADVVINPDTECIEERALELTRGDGFDVIIDASGAFYALENILDILARGGKLMLFSNYSIDEVLHLNLMDMYWKENTIYTIFGATVSSYTADVATILHHLNLKILIDQILPLEDMEKALQMYGTRQHLRLLVKV